MRCLDRLRSVLAPQILDYVALKRALGRSFDGGARVLAHLDGHLADRRARSLTAREFGEWALTIDHIGASTRRSRMLVVRAFCEYLRRRNPGQHVPDQRLFPRVHPPRRPHIFTEGEIARLLAATGRIRPHSNSPLLGPVQRLAVVLLYTTGMRRGELVRLTLGDHDAIERTLLVRSSKFHKSRLLALSDDAADEITRYLAARRQLPGGDDAPLLVNASGGLHGYSGAGLAQGLRTLFRRAGVTTVRGTTPRVHDLRHTHAVHALLRWYREGRDVQTVLPALAVSMGHVSVVSTAYYLSLLGPVVDAAAERFESHLDGLLAAASVAGGRS